MKQTWFAKTIKMNENMNKNIYYLPKKIHNVHQIFNNVLKEVINIGRRGFDGALLPYGRIIAYFRFGK